MNKYTFSFFATVALLFLSAKNVQAQRYSGEYPHIVTIGTNVVDDSFTTKKKMLNYAEQWNWVAYPSFAAYTYNVSEHFLIEGALSINRYQSGKLVDGVKLNKELRYTAIDANVKYDLSGAIYDIDFLSNAQPFVVGGLGITSIDGVSRTTVNYGVGAYLWLRIFQDTAYYGDGVLDNIGIVFQTMGKSSFEQKKYGNQIQHTIGLVFRY